MVTVEALLYTVLITLEKFEGSNLSAIFYYSRTPLNPYLSVDGSGYGLWVNFGVNLSFVAAGKYGL